MASFESVDYSVRMRKNIERKLISELFVTLNPKLKLSSRYQYIGMGSLWFSDFICFHKVLGLKKMWSIEKFSPKRAEFNSPFGFLRIKGGAIGDEAPSLMKPRVRSILWLDYDHDLRDGIVDDVQKITQFAHAGDILMVTVNARSGQVKPASIGDIGYLNKLVDRYSEEDAFAEIDVDLPTEKLIPTIKSILEIIQNKQQTETVKEKAKRFNTLTKNVVAKEFKNEDFSEEKFPSLVAEALFNAIDSTSKSLGKSLRFHPLFNFFYKDGAPMVTIGGIVVNDKIQKVVDRLRLAEKHFFIQGSKQVSIDVPNLTSREKQKIDSLINMETDPEVKDLIFEFEAEALANYCTFYRQYPLFSEMLF